jgi:hypothetical protein
MFDAPNRVPESHLQLCCEAIGADLRRFPLVMYEGDEVVFRDRIDAAIAKLWRYIALVHLELVADRAWLVRSFSTRRPTLVDRNHVKRVRALDGHFSANFFSANRFTWIEAGLYLLIEAVRPFSRVCDRARREQASEQRGHRILEWDVAPITPPLLPAVQHLDREARREQIRESAFPQGIDRSGS